jgi:hypothetical protein
MAESSRTRFSHACFSWLRRLFLACFSACLSACCLLVEGPLCTHAPHSGKTSSAAMPLVDTRAAAVSVSRAYSAECVRAAHGSLTRERGDRCCQRPSIIHYGRCRTKLERLIRCRRGRLDSGDGAAICRPATLVARRRPACEGMPRRPGLRFAGRQTGSGCFGSGDRLVWLTVRPG